MSQHLLTDPRTHPLTGSPEVPVPPASGTTGARNAAPTVSVVIPARNEARNLELLIPNLAADTLADALVADLARGPALAGADSGAVRVVGDADQGIMLTAAVTERGYPTAGAVVVYGFPSAELLDDYPDTDTLAAAAVADIRYLVLDDRITTGPSVRGYFFNPDEPGAFNDRGGFPADAITNAAQRGDLELVAATGHVRMWRIDPVAELARRYALDPSGTADAIEAAASVPGVARLAGHDELADRTVALAAQVSERARSRR